jgi:hypothetical protein
MLGEQFDGGTVPDRVSLGQIFHGFHQRALAVHVARIGSSFSFLAAYAGKDWNGKNFGHEKFTYNPGMQVYLPMFQFSALIFDQ